MAIQEAEVVRHSSRRSRLGVRPHFVVLGFGVLVFVSGREPICPSSAGATRDPRRSRGQQPQNQHARDTEGGPDPLAQRAGVVGTDARRWVFGDLSWAHQPEWPKDITIVQVAAEDLELPHLFESYFWASRGSGAAPSWRSSGAHLGRMHGPCGFWSDPPGGPLSVRRLAEQTRRTLYGESPAWNGDTSYGIRSMRAAWGGPRHRAHRHRGGRGHPVFAAVRSRARAHMQRWSALMPGVVLNCVVILALTLGRWANLASFLLPTCSNLATLGRNWYELGLAASSTS